jgi:glycosyltransferase involved in cell wall biosynthesis
LPLTYSVVTPARNEADALPRLGEALAAQTILPEKWVIAENGSVDETADVARALADRHGWVQLVVVEDARPRERGAPIVNAFQSGLEHMDSRSDIVAMVDCDITMDSDHFEKLLSEFEARPSLGIASGSLWEFDGSQWRERFNTGSSVWGGLRAYRRTCLHEVMPLEERVGWDGIDEFRARARGWDTATVGHLPFRHHRPEGAHDRSTWALWRANGETAHFLGYRLWYQVARTLHNMTRDPAALGLMWGYARSALTRQPRLDDAAARAVVRRDQRLRNALGRRREALGRRPRT